MAEDLANESGQQIGVWESDPALPEGATPWEVHKRLGEMKERAGDAVRRSLVVFFVLCALQEFLKQSSYLS